ncbi:MAG: CHASE domain-containing protein [Burkholderiales bacterium]|nr:CHASE domain-containing protein [Burkholderiales bacterium]
MRRLASTFHAGCSRSGASEGAPAQGPLALLPRRMQGHALAGAALAFLVLLAVSVSMWSKASEEIVQVARERFEFRVAEANFAIQQRMLAYEQVLRGGIGLFAASNEVTREAWRIYVQQLNLEKNYPGIQAIAYSQRILPEQLQAHLQKIRVEGFPQYAVRPDGQREEYVSVIYIEPFDWRNQRAFGFDLMTESVRRAALVRARDTGLPTLTGKIRLQQETSKAVQNGFLMCMPVFRNGAVPPALELRRAALSGHLCSVFRMNDLMQGILGPERRPNTHLEIFDGAASPAANLMYDSLEGVSAMGQAPSAFSASQTLEFGGRRWTLRYSSLPAFDAGIDVQKPRQILLSGLLVSALFAAVLWSWSLNRRRARELAGANAGLKSEIAERSKLEADLKLAKNAAEAANQAKSAFLTSVSHELRTPLTLILAPLEQLLSASQPAVAVADARVQLERAQRNALLLLNRVNDILDFSKAEAGKSEVHSEAVDAAASVATLAGDAALVAHGKGCTLTWQTDPALGTVCLDRQYFEKILLNLVSNALKFTPAGGWIRVELTALAQDRFELAVADSGIGIAPDKLALLFRRFQQVDASITRQYGGTGIGLALVKELAELMGGQVGVQSEPGHGARFTVSLPRGTARLSDPALASAAQRCRGLAQPEAAASLRRIRLEESAPGTPITSGAGTGPAAPGVARPRVLVADDNRDMRDYLVELLCGECEVLAAADGMEAWEMLQRSPLDLVLSDVMMPALDGLALSARIKASASLSHVPVILVTARGGCEASASGLESGADDYVAKPFSPLEIQARVRAALRMGRVQAQLRQQSRVAGMAMIRSGILHNLGNVLSGVTVSSAIIQDRLRQSKVTMLHMAAKLLQEHAHDLPERLAAMPAYLSQLAKHLEAEHSAQLQEVGVLRECVEHARGVIASEQRLGQPGAERQELLAVDEVAESALKLGVAAFDLHAVAVERDFAYRGAVAADRHKLLQILMNLLANAAHALRASADPDKRIWVRTACAGDRVRLEVHDNGAGIAAHQLAVVFNQGYTTHAEGHGYGLHSSANWARELGGTLSCRSEGVGCGASFILDLPLPQVQDCGRAQGAAQTQIA